jgi:cation diffusion facilitator family transporter
MAECAHSLFDLISSVLAYIGIKQASKPNDECHMYGHDKFENFSSLLQAVLITITACFVLHHAYDKFKSPSPVENSIVGIVLMIISIPVTYFTAKYLDKMAHAHGGSFALEADSAHFTTDVLSSISVLVGLLFVKFGVSIADIIAAVIVAIIMLYISFKLIMESYHVFMDRSPADEVMLELKMNLTALGVEYHKLRARRAGSKIFIDFHRETNGNITVEQANKDSNKIRTDLMKRMPNIADVNIQVQPRKKEN